MRSVFQESPIQVTHGVVRGGLSWKKTRFIVVHAETPATMGSIARKGSVLLSLQIVVCEGGRTANQRKCIWDAWLFAQCLFFESIERISHRRYIHCCGCIGGLGLSNIGVDLYLLAVFVFLCNDLQVIQYYLS